MAAITLLAKTAVMRIITAVTGTAGLIQFDFARYGLAMAALTMYLGVGTVELEIGILIVIEAPYPPTVRIVAGGAFAAEGSLMHIVFLVAGIAGVGIHLVATGQMALLTGYRSMETDKRKTGQIMIEDYALIPFLFIMATCTTFTFFTLMDVICLMTGEASIAFLFLVQITPMAILTRNILMRAP